MRRLAFHKKENPREIEGVLWGFSFAGFVFCSTEWFVFVAPRLTGQQSSLLSGLRSRLVAVVLDVFRFWALTPAVEPEPCSCSLLSSGSAGIALWALGKSGGIVCPLQAKQSSYINGEPGDTRLAQTNPNIQFKTLRNDNQMSKAYVSASKSSGLCSGGGYGGRQARKQSFRVGSDSVNLRGIGVVFCSEAAIPAMIFHYTIIHTGVVI